MSNPLSASSPPALMARHKPSLLEQPAVAWVLVVGLFLITFLGSIAGAGSLMRLAFPAGSTLVAVYLYFFHPVFYINFNWWVWCSTPLLRRLADYYRGDYDELSLMLTAPYLVTLVCIVTLFRQFPKAHRTGDIPFIMAAGAVFFGFLIGGLNNPATAVARTFLDWMPPVLFGLHISISWRIYPTLRRTTQTVFIWISLLAGAYGIYQYMVAPGWDTYWLEAVGNVSFGLPFPQQIRVWSTMNSPPPFGCVMMAITLLLFVCKGPLLLPAAGVGYLSLMLSLVRAAWAGWIVGLITLVASLKSKLQIKLLATIVVMALCVVPLTMIEPFNDVIGDRLESFTSIQNDSSYEARAETYSENLDTALSGLLGQGLGSTWVIQANGQLERVALDSGILDTFFTLGWFGGLPYIAGMLMLLFNQFRGDEGRTDPFASGARAITLSFFAILSLGPFMLGLAGMFMWGFLGFGMAARKHALYQEQQRKQELATQIASVRESRMTQEEPL
ncbi:O-antigen ligase domain-containing protein [Vacuolonema iberomarrocanum]|uniref:O-antigen ligase domain-containing protein n=1 Tax=Vacuolonema iberomarrocanum TaxID=3454632 RepID=UPI0019EF77AA|nr:O-antigen ligase domain-containing protein [filamentous cyanobacterium LEGE 07170]